MVVLLIPILLCNTSDMLEKARPSIYPYILNIAAL